MKTKPFTRHVHWKSHTTSLLTTLLSLLSACGSNLQKSTPFDESPPLRTQTDTLNLGQSQAILTVLGPVAKKIVSGQTSVGQSLSVLNEASLTGTEDDYAAYIDFLPDRQLNVQFEYQIDAGHLPASGLTLRSNFMGWNKAKQRWFFQAWDFSNKKWVLLGDNALAKAWEWTMLTFSFPGEPQSFINPSGRVRIRYRTPSALENSFLDSLTIEVQSLPAPLPVLTPTPAPLPQPTPTAQPTQPPPASHPILNESKLYGVTIDSIANIDVTHQALNLFPQKMTVRVVFDEFMPASYYAPAVRKIGSDHFIMGEILDSFSMKDYTVSSFQARVEEYLDSMSEDVDIWEIGNEINGEWLGSTQDVVSKLRGAYDKVKQRSKLTALTLYYNPDCWAKPENEMFRWAETNIPRDMRDGLDYVFVSYYEEDCNNLKAGWPAVIERVGQIFPRALIGVGESGTRDYSQKSDLIENSYTMKVDHPRYVGGTFWWYFIQDMVPHTKEHWGVLKSAIQPESTP